MFFTSFPSVFIVLGFRLYRRFPKFWCQALSFISIYPLEGFLWIFFVFRWKMYFMGWLLKFSVLIVEEFKMFVPLLNVIFYVWL